jgi:hypothetical protein
MAQEVAIKKKQAISNAQRNMLIVVACASIVIGFALVGSIFLFEQLLFNNKVIEEQNKTVKTLQDNNVALGQIRDEIRPLEQNTALRSVMVGADGNALRVIGDALPLARETGPNESALGASLVKILQLRTAVRINSFAFDTVATPVAPPPVATPGTGAAGAGPAVAVETGATRGAMGFRFEIEGSPENVTNSLQNLERSIRQIDISTMNVEFSSNGNLRMSVRAVAYYMNPRSINLVDREVTK